MAGEFHAGGVHCEQCHGLGSNHQITESADDIHIDNTSADGKLFNEDGSLANVDGLGVSLDYVSGSSVGAYYERQAFRL